jgi:D-2-hydroxyacid dehydrogenase (NADP+)
LAKAPINIVINYSFQATDPAGEEIERKIKAVSPRIRVWDLVPLLQAEKQGNSEARKRVNSILAEADIYCGYPIKGLTTLAPKLKWIQSAIAGVNGFLNPQLVANKTLLTKASIHDRQISENVFNYILMLARRSIDYFRAQEQKKPLRFVPVVLHRKTLGILGLGNIGQRVARLGKAFGMKVIATRAHPEKRDPNVDVMLPPDGLHELLRQSDFVVDLLPHTKETENVIGEAELRLMKPTAFIINVGRGSTIDLEALMHALKEGWIAGAALDALPTDPGPPPEALLELKNVIVTPHVSGQRADYKELLNRQFLQNLRRYLRGQELLNIADKQQGF